MMNQNLFLFLHFLCLQVGFTSAGMSSGMKSGMGMSYKSMGMSKSYKGYKGGSMSMGSKMSVGWGMSMKKSCKKDGISKIDKLNMMSYKYGNGYKGMSMMRSWMSTKKSKGIGNGKGKGKGKGKGSGSYPDDDVDDYFGGKGKGTSGSSKGMGSATAVPTRQGSIKVPTISPSEPTLAPTRTEGVETTLSPQMPTTVAPIATTAPAASTPAPDSTSTPDSSQQTESPVFASCETAAGIYGSMNDNGLTVPYGYELETDPATAAELRTQVIPPLEIAFNNYLLPNLFPGVCGQSTARRRRLAVQGISTVPADAAQFGIPCRTPKSDPANDCVYVRGQLTVYTDEIGPREQYVSTVRNGLRLGMENGAFDDAQEKIIKVTYVETGSDGFPVDSVPTVSPGNPQQTQSPAGVRAIETDDDDDDRNLLLPLLLVAGAVLIVATGIVTYRNT